MDIIKKNLKDRRDRVGYYQRRNWTIKEVKYLKDNFEDKNYELLCSHLNRSYNSVCRKLQRLKLKKYHKWL